ncbi:MAG: ADP-ribosyl-(dinitrogen reductase) hydrolase [Pseudohongiellaceae bacterium]
MNFIFSQDIRKKLALKHEVSTEEVEQCFWNRSGGLVEDDREDHKTNPPTYWFVSETDKKRRLKVIFVQDGEKVFIKSAYDATIKIIKIYEKFAVES